METRVHLRWKSLQRNLACVGKIIKLKSNLLEMCGRGFTLTAYISDAGNGGKYYGWQHNFHFLSLLH